MLKDYIKIIHYACIVIALTGCVLGERNISEEYSSFDAYGERWTYYLDAIRKDYFTLDSDSFSYPVFEKYIRSEKGVSVNLSDSIFVIQKDGSFSKYYPDFRGTNGIYIWNIDDKIFLSINGVPLVEMTDCYGFTENNTGELTPNSHVELFGEFDVESNKFYLSQFIPFSSSIYGKMRNEGMHPKEARTRAYHFPVNLNCSIPLNLDATNKEIEKIWAEIDSLP